MVCGYASLSFFHMEDCACLKEPNIISWLWDELYCVS